VQEHLTNATLSPITLVIPKPALSARNLLPSGSEAADSSRGNPRLEMTIL
jgi:hypothetical protein